VSPAEPPVPPNPVRQRPMQRHLLLQQRVMRWVIGRRLRYPGSPITAKWPELERSSDHRVLLAVVVVNKGGTDEWLDLSRRLDRGYSVHSVLPRPALMATAWSED
jgi:hypothetical protein